MTPLFLVFTRVFLRAVACLVLLVCWSEALGGSVLFQNWKAWYGYSVTNEQPVFLPDCQTRASGSNFVVELLAPQGQLLATTYLAEGAFAGLFGGYSVSNYYVSYYSVDSPLLASCATELLTVRVWDRRTGTNFDSATLRGALSFENYILGGCGSGAPFPPEELTGFRSFALGNSQCFTNPTVVSFGYVEWIVRRSSPTANLFVQRSGDLGQTNSVTYFTSDDTARAGLNYIPATGMLTFAPGEVSKSFTVQFLPESISDQWLWVNVGLTNVTGNAQVGAAVKTSVFDDRPVLRWVPASGPTNTQLQIRFIRYGPYPFYHLWLQYSPSLASTNWSTIGDKYGYWWDYYWNEWMDVDGIHYVLSPNFPFMRGPSTGFYRAGASQ